MENQFNRDPNLDKSHKDSGQENPQKDQDKNKNWDQAQRRQQASPRSYNENLDSENIENQNTEAANGQSDRPIGEMPDNEGRKQENEGRGKVGDSATARQQSRNKGSQQDENGDSRMKLK